MVYERLERLDGFTTLGLISGRRYRASVRYLRANQRLNALGSGRMR